MTPMTLEIGSTWDGAPARTDERATLTVAITPEALVLSVDAPLHDDPAPPGPAGPTWGLWEHEVVELFVLGAQERYLEIELGPGGHHLVLQLHGRRNIVARELALDLRVERAAGRWTAVARLDPALLPPAPHRLNAYAIHGVGPARRYLAWTPVPGPAPDFHRLECFPPMTPG